MPNLMTGERFLKCMAVAMTCAVFLVGSANAADQEVTGDDADRRDATLTYYAFHIAKLDARVSFCDGARTDYRTGFEEVVNDSGTAIHDNVMQSYDDRYETFVVGIGDYDCPNKELSHYRTRLTKQIKNLRRDLVVLR